MATYRDVIRAMSKSRKTRREDLDRAEHLERSRLLLSIPMREKPLDYAFGCCKCDKLILQR